VSPLREFCPTCGTPTDPDLREKLLRARSPRPDEGRKGARGPLLLGGGALLLALAVAGNFAWSDLDRDQQDRPAGPVTIEAEELYQAYRDDPDAASREFAGREMVVSGEFLRIVPDGYGSLDLRLNTSNPDRRIGPSSGCWICRPNFSVLVTKCSRGMWRRQSRTRVTKRCRCSTWR
jgi:hypothetical protein